MHAVQTLRALHSFLLLTGFFIQPGSLLIQYNVVHPSCEIYGQGRGWPVKVIGITGKAENWELHTKSLLWILSLPLV